MQNWMYVFLGGGMGSLVRYGFGIYFSSSESGFPIATFISNIIACLILGILIASQLKNNLSDNQGLLLMTGFCGGFSTFSTFSSESMKLFQSQQYALGLFYIGSSIILGLLAVYLGIKLYNLV